MTPGPWIVTAGGVLRHAATKTEIAVFDTTRGPWLENANICAAAPDLLFAALVAESWLQSAIDDGAHSDRARADLEKVRAAIAQARGGSR